MTNGTGKSTLVEALAVAAGFNAEGGSQSFKVLPHDDAYDWACRRRVSVNRATGVIEVRDVAAIEERLPQLTEAAAR